MSTNTDLVNKFNDLILALNTIIFGEGDVTLDGLTKPTIDKVMKSIGGMISAANLTALQAIIPNYTYQLGLDQSTGKLYSWSGTAWVDTGRNFTTDLTTYVDGNANFKAKSIGSGVNLNTFVTDGVYHKVGSGDTSAALNYPVNLAGSLRVFTPASGTTMQTYLVSSNGSLYTRYLQGGVWSTWAMTETTTGSQAKVDAAIKSNVSHFIWTIAGFNTPVTFDASTKTMAWTAPLIAPSRNHTANRIYIPAGSIVIDVDAIANGVVYLDLSQVPTSGTLAVSDIPNCIKYNTYPTWRGEPNLVPIARKDNTQNSGVALVAVNNFVRILNSFDTSGQVELRGRALEWHKVSSESSVTFNESTKTLTISGYILGTFDKGAAPYRIRMQNISVTFANPYEVLYIDTTLLPSTNDIVQADVGTILKVGTYSNTFRHNAKQIPIVKYDHVSNKAVAAAGFVPVINSGSTPTTGGSSDYFPYSKTATQLDVYLPTTSGKKIKIGLKRQVAPFDGTSPDSQSDLWRIFEAWQVDPDTMASELMICNNGEWECAIQVVGETDHVGGYHGDELQTASMFYIDGVSYAQDAVKSGTAKSITFSQESIIYFQNTQTAMAKHKKLLVFSKDGIALKQTIEWLANANLATAWLTMVPIMRLVGEVQVTDRSARLDDYFLQVDDNTNEGFVRRYTPVKDGSKVRVWGDTSKVALEVTLVKTAGWNPSQNVFVTNGGGYNKIYVSAFNGANTSGIPVATGTVWECETFFALNKS